MKLLENTAWVVYLMTVHGKQPGQHAVCSEAEWGTMEAKRPGFHLLVRRVTGSEGAAETCARSLQKPPAPTPKKRDNDVTRFFDTLPTTPGLPAA